MKNLNPLYLQEKLFLGSLFTSKRPVELSGKAIRKHFAKTPDLSLINVAHNNKESGREIAKEISKLKAQGKVIPKNLSQLERAQLDVTMYQNLSRRIKEHPIRSLLDGTYKRFLKFKKENPEIEKFIIKDPELKAIIDKIGVRRLNTGMTYMNSSHTPFKHNDFVAATENLPNYPEYQKIIGNVK